MMKGIFMVLRSTLILIMALIMSGCTTLADSVAAKGTGISKTYSYPKDKVWPIAVDSVKSSKLDLISASKESGLILAQRGVTAFSYGENVAVFVDSESESSCKVEVVSKRAMETNVFAPDWSATILNGITRKLKDN